MELNGYELSRKWFDFAFENPSKISPNHGILYFFCIEHCNRLGWKKEFGLPTTMAKEAIGIRSYNTYIKTLNDLIDWGFINLIEKSKNQYSSNIIALSNFNKATNKALDKAFIKHDTKQLQSTVQSIGSIDKQETKEPLTKKPRTNISAKALPDLDLSECKDLYNNFIIGLTGGAGAKFDGTQINAMKTIIAYMKTQMKEPGAKVSTGLKVIFDNWDIIEPFLRNQTTLTQINKNLQNIIVQIKNHGKFRDKKEPTAGRTKISDLKQFIEHYSSEEYRKE